MSFDATAQMGPTDPAGNIVTDLPCKKCAYNIRGLNIYSRCPECGSPVGMSVHGDLLRFSDPVWVGTLRSGIGLIIMGIAAVIIVNILLAVAGAAMGMAQDSLQLVTGVVNLLGYIVIIVGSWKLTEPDPSGVGEDHYGTSRKIIRLSLITGAASNVVQLIMQVAPLPPAIATPFAVLIGIAGLIGIVGIFAQLSYLSKLALRIPDHKIHDRAKFLMWAFGITGGLLIVLSVALGFMIAAGSRAGTGGGPGGLAGLGCFMGILGLALVVFGIMYLLMLDKLNKQLKEQVNMARSTWAQSAA